MFFFATIVKQQIYFLPMRANHLCWDGDSFPFPLLLISWCGDSEVNGSHRLKFMKLWLSPSDSISSWETKAFNLTEPKIAGNRSTHCLNGSLKVKVSKARKCVPWSICYMWTKHLVSPNKMGMAEYLQAGKTNWYLEYVSIPVKINFYSFQTEKSQINQHNQVTNSSFLEVLWNIRASLGSSVIQKHHQQDQLW